MPQIIINSYNGAPLVFQCLRLRLAMQGVLVQSLVGHLRSHMPHSQETKQLFNKKNKTKNKFNKGFKKWSM